MGPLLQVMIFSLFKNNLVYKYNLSILLFNLIPIYPLDGGRILNLLFNKRISYIKSLSLSIFISFIIIILLFIISIKYKLLINFISILCFLLSLIIKEHNYKSYYFNKFKLERILHKYNFKKNKIIKSDKEMMRDNKHIFFINNHYLTEKEYLTKRQNKKSHLSV